MGLGLVGAFGVGARLMQLNVALLDAPQHNGQQKEDDDEAEKRIDPGIHFTETRMDISRADHALLILQNRLKHMKSSTFKITELMAGVGPYGFFQEIRIRRVRGVFHPEGRTAINTR